MVQQRNNCFIIIRPEMYIVLALSVLLLPVSWTFSWLAAACVHELFHYGALKLCKCSISRIQIGVNGAVMDTPTMSYGKEAFCAIAGPLGGFTLLLAAKWLPKVAICAFFQSTYNLMPVFPMDGGRVLRGLIYQCFSWPAAQRIVKWAESTFLCFLMLACFYISFAFSVGPIPLIWAGVLIIKSKLINSPCKEGRLRVQ